MKLLKRINYYKEGKKVGEKRDGNIFSKIKTSIADIRKQIDAKMADDQLKKLDPYLNKMFTPEIKKRVIQYLNKE